MKELEALKAHIRNVGPVSVNLAIRVSTDKTRLFVASTVTHANADAHELLTESIIQCHSDGSVDEDATLNDALRLAASRLNTWVSRSSVCSQHRRKRIYKSLVKDVARIHNYVGIIRNDGISAEILLRTYNAMIGNDLSWDSVLKSVSMIKDRLATKSLVFQEERA